METAGLQRLSQCLSLLSLHLSPKALSILENTSSLLIWEGQALRLLCAAASNPPAELSWFRGSPALNATPMCTTHILELPQVGAAEEGTLTCRAQNSLGSQHVSLRLSVVCECGDPRGRDARDLGSRGAADPAPPPLQAPRGCSAPPAPGRARRWAAPAPPEPGRPPPCAGGWGRGCWRGTTATLP